MTNIRFHKITIVLTFLLLAFMFTSFWFIPELSVDRRATLLFCRAMLAGLVCAFMIGSVELHYDLPRTNGGKLAVSATGGFTLFLVLLYAEPYFDRPLVERCRAAAPTIGGLIGACEGECTITNSSADVHVTVDGVPYDRERWISRCIERGQ